ncbi:programmed cell death protein 5-like [Varroa jacobsoni]|uniref:Programmed cell death protein 5 n=1 Tax=Varroa destructor TaxID=109461 RepID=A0A7M7K1L8_VARDE|nr:programmed cell death protein 5-like [Varroa destructor]XP_022704628.1 programmed cell death protein 5-like [Varroa jacobsoni]
MADDELAAIRARRLAQFQAEVGGPGAQQPQDDAQQREEDMRNRILQQVLSQQARARLSTIAAAKPEKAAMIEQMVIRTAQMNGTGRKISEQELIGLLEKVSEQTQRTTKVIFKRRKGAFDSDDDDW